MDNIERSAEADVKKVAIDFFEKSFSDEFGYVTEKRDRINSLSDGDAWVSFQMIHPISRQVLYYYLSDTAKQYLIKHELFKEDGSLYTGV